MLAALAAAGLTVAAVAPARAATGLPTPPPLPSSLAAVPTLLPTPSPTPTPPSTLCSAPVVSGVTYTWQTPANPAEPAWTQPAGPGGKPDLQVAEWNADTGYLTVTGSNLVQQGCAPVLASVGAVGLGYAYDPGNSSQPGSASPQSVRFDFTPAQTLTATGATAAQPAGLPTPTNPTGQAQPATPASIASGVVVVAEKDPTGASQDSSKSPHQYVIVQEPPAPTLSSPTPHEGDAETISGTGGFSQFEAGQTGAVSGSQLQTSFAGCEGLTIPGGYAPPADTQKQPLDLSVVTDVPYAYCNGAVGVQFGFAPDASQPSYCAQTPPPGAKGANCELFSETAGNIDVAFDLGTVVPNPVAPGGTILVEGAGFGTSGAARIDGTALTVCAGCWSDRFVILKAPAHPLSGYLFLRRTQTGGDGAEVQWKAPITVRAGAPAGPGAGYTGIPLGDLLPGGALQFVPGHVGGPPSGQGTENELNLTVSKNKADAGTDITFTVTIATHGTPVAGAPVTLSIVSAPGTDTVLSPTSGATNLAGRLSGTLHLSSSPGTTLLLARSGVHSDEVTVLGQKPAAAGLFGGKLPFGLNIDLSGNPLVVWLSVATALLILVGVVVNLDVLRRFLWSITFRRLIRRHRAHPPAAA